MKLHLGCGQCVASGWINVDYALGARVAKIPGVAQLSRRVGLFRSTWDARILIHDLRERFPWADGSATAIYSSHTLEHLARDEGRRFLRECHRVLARRGILRIVVPDLAHMVESYRSGKLESDRFLEELGVVYGVGKRGLAAKLAPLVEFPHRCMYDELTLLRVLDECGFSCRAVAAFESEIPGIEAVEVESRTQAAVIAEGRRS